jgi:uncharacterized protein (DUF169 family)
MEWREQARRMTDFLRLTVRPVGVRLLRKEEADEVRAVRPGRDLGRKFAFCQALSIAGRTGLPVLVTGQDESCIAILPAFGMGRFDPPTKVPESQCAMGWVKDEDTAMKFVTRLSEDALPEGEYTGLYACPLENMELRPEVIMIYALYDVSFPELNPVYVEYDKHLERL